VGNYRELASYQHCLERIQANWHPYQKKRNMRLEQQQRYGVTAEKVAENILEDLFTDVLDWTLADINYQVDYADMLLTKLGIKYLLVEVKRPGLLAWHRRAIEPTLDQARRYASEQKVRSIAISDGEMLYAVDMAHGGFHDRIFASLASPEPPEILWWLSVHGIYRECEVEDPIWQLPDQGPVESGIDQETQAQLLHHKYKIPACCFAYVGDPNDPATWKLPYRLADNSLDVQRLPKAIQAILSNYRGAKVSSVPERDIPDVLVRLAHAAASLGRMPHQSPSTAEIYVQLASVLEQLGRLEEVTREP